jgi:hypothetical protein
VSDVVLEVVEPRVAALLHRLHRAVDFALVLAQRLQLAAAVVDNSNSRGEAELQRALPDHQRIVRVLNAAADHRVDVDVKIGMFGEKL